MFASRYFPDRYFARRFWPAVGAAPAAADIRRIPVEETFAWQRPVLEILSTPPGSPTKGQRYLVGAGATGAWAGHEDDIAWYYASGWKYDTPGEGWTTFNRDDSTVYQFIGGAWTPLGAHLSGPFPVLAADPASPADLTWWVVAEGSSPTMTVEVRVRIGGVTYALPGITL